jgi:hypothetical protein
MRRIFLWTVIGCNILCSHAFAGEIDPCAVPISKLKPDVKGHARLSTLNAAQLHFAEGLFVATPPVTGAMPPGDGAILIVSKDRKGGLLIWTKGTNACTTFTLPDALVRTLSGLNSSVGEIVLPDDSGEERQL